MLDKEIVKQQIQTAFGAVKYPGDWCLRGSDEGDEPFEVEEAFKGKTDWRTLDPAFIDQAPGGLASALSFFSDEAFRFYLPAYLLADIDGQLKCSDPLFHLTHGLDDTSCKERINPRRYGERTWFEAARYKFSMFSNDEVAAIVAYLKFRCASKPYKSRRITQALDNYWNSRLTNPTL